MLPAQQQQLRDCEGLTLEQGQVTPWPTTGLIANTAPSGTRTLPLQSRPKLSASARARQAAFVSGASFCCPVVLQPPRCYPGLPEAGVPEQDAERWECHWQAELLSDGASPGLTARPKPGEMSLGLAEVTRASSKARPPRAGVATKARRSHPAVSEATWLMEGFWL